MVFVKSPRSRKEPDELTFRGLIAIWGWGREDLGRRQRVRKLFRMLQLHRISKHGLPWRRPHRGLQSQHHRHARLLPHVILQCHHHLSESYKTRHICPAKRSQPSRARIHTPSKPSPGRPHDHTPHSLLHHTAPVSLTTTTRQRILPTQPLYKTRDQGSAILQPSLSQAANLAWRGLAPP